MSGRPRNEDKKAMKSDDVVKPGRGRPRRSPTKAERTPSPARAKKTPKSPAKRAGSKSPARKVQAEKKSPSRAAPQRRKSPARVSPARAVKITTSTPIIDIDSDSDEETKIPKPQFQIRGRTRKVNPETPIRVAENSYLEALKPRTRLSASRESERIIPLKEDFVIGQEKKLTEFSDEDEIVMKKIDVEPPKIQLRSMFRSEFGDLYGSLFFINIVPIMTVATEFFLTKRSDYSLEHFKKLSTYYDLYSYLGVLIFVLANFIFAKFPFGARPEGQLKAFSTSSYVANGWFSLISSYAVWFGLEYYGIPISGYVYDHFAHIMMAGLLFGFLLSVLLYVQSSYVPVGSLNPMGNTNNEIYDFFVGRQVAPTVFGVHMKVFLIRTVSIAKSIFTIILLAKSLNITKPVNQYTDPNVLKSLNIDPTMIAICTMIYITVIDKIYFEKTWASTFELRHEGQGYLCNMQFIASAFLYPLMAKYVYDHNVKLDLCTLGVLSAAFLVAAVLNCASNNQKYVFRVNPYSPKVANYETIPTSQGRKLLAGGLWGLVRHPNYLTEIIINACLATFVWKSPIVVYIGYVLVMLLYRVCRVEYRMKQKYETAWDRYCEQVKYKVLPKVY